MTSCALCSRPLMVGYADFRLCVSHFNCWLKSGEYRRWESIMHADDRTPFGSPRDVVAFRDARAAVALRDFITRTRREA